MSRILVIATIVAVVAAIAWAVATKWPQTRRWSGAYGRCRQWTLGPFMTDWRCLLPHDHAEVEGNPHIFEPDLWPGGRFHDEWVGRGGLAIRRCEEPEEGTT